MKARSVIQAYLVITLISVHLLLIFKFFADFTAYDFSTLEPLYDLGNMLVGPFRGTFEASINDGATFDFSTIFAMIVYGGIWLVFMSISKVGQFGAVLDKLLHFNDIFFKIINCLFITRLIFTFLEIKESSFVSFVNGITNLLIKPLHLILPIDMEEESVLRIEIGISIIFILFFWGIAQKLIRTFIKAPRDIPYSPSYIPQQQESVRDEKPALDTRIDPNKTAGHKGFTPSQPKKVESNLPTYTYKSGPKINQQVTSTSSAKKTAQKPSQDKLIQKESRVKSTQNREIQPQATVQPKSQLTAEPAPIQPGSIQQNATQTNKPTENGQEINTRKDTTIDKLTRQMKTFFMPLKEFVIEIVSKEKEEDVSPFGKSKKDDERYKSPLQN